MFVVMNTSDAWVFGIGVYFIKGTYATNARFSSNGNIKIILHPKDKNIPGYPTEAELALLYVKKYMSYVPLFFNGELCS